MAVYKYVSGAWQETSEVPKKYVNSAWEDSDGYAYENGVWVEKWSAKPQPLYIIKNGVRQSGFNFTTSKTGGSDYYSTYWTQGGDGSQYAVAKTPKGGNIGIRLLITGSINISEYTKLYCDGVYAFSNSKSDPDASSSLSITGTGGTINSINMTTSRSTKSSNIVATTGYTIICQAYANAYASTNQRTTTGRIYNLWLEA